jgi:hypothetical protein
MSNGNKPKIKTIQSYPTAPDQFSLNTQKSMINRSLIIVEHLVLSSYLKLDPRNNKDLIERLDNVLKPIRFSYWYGSSKTKIIPKSLASDLNNVSKIRRSFRFITLESVSGFLGPNKRWTKHVIAKINSKTETGDGFSKHLQYNPITYQVQVEHLVNYLIKDKSLYSKTHNDFFPSPIGNHLIFMLNKDKYAIRNEFNGFKINSRCSFFGNLGISFTICVLDKNGMICSFDTRNNYSDDDLNSYQNYAKLQNRDGIFKFKVYCKEDVELSLVIESYEITPISEAYVIKSLTMPGVPGSGISEVDNDRKRNGNKLDKLDKFDKLYTEYRRKVDDFRNDKIGVIILGCDGSTIYFIPNQLPVSYALNVLLPIESGHNIAKYIMESIDLNPISKFSIRSNDQRQHIRDCIHEVHYSNRWKPLKSMSEKYDEMNGAESVESDSDLEYEESDNESNDDNDGSDNESNNK